MGWSMSITFVSTSKYRILLQKSTQANDTGRVTQAKDGKSLQDIKENCLIVKISTFPHPISYQIAFSVESVAILDEEKKQL